LPQSVDVHEARCAYCFALIRRAPAPSANLGRGAERVSEACGKQLAARRDPSWL
jgi:hypothetical protein